MFHRVTPSMCLFTVQHCFLHLYTNSFSQIVYYSMSSLVCQRDEGSRLRRGLYMTTKLETFTTATSDALKIPLKCNSKWLSTVFILVYSRGWYCLHQTFTIHTLQNWESILNSQHESISNCKRTFSLHTKCH